MLVRPLAGLWIDRYGRRRFMLLGAAATALSFAAYALTDDPYLLLPVRMIHGISMVLFTSGALAMTADIAPARRRGTAVAYLAMVNNLAQLYAPWAALAMAEAWGFTPYFSIAAVVATGSFVAAGGITEHRTPVTPAPEFSAVAMVSRSALLPASVFLSMTIAFGAIQAFLPLLTDDRDLGNAGLFFVVFGAVIVPLRPLVGALADRYGRTGVVLPGLVLGGLAMILLALASTQGMMLASAVAFGFGFAGVHTGLLAMTVDRAGSEERGVAVSTFALAWDLGAGAGAMGLGLVAGSVSLGAVFVIAGALPLASTVLLLPTLRLPRPGAPQTPA
jgi:MFS family permease